MKIRILGTESLGVRGLSCEVIVEERVIVIDPGLALGYRRYGLLPHPDQVAVGEEVRAKITNALQGATDIVFSHFHGDHIPLPDANPYQLSAQQVAHLFHSVRIWSKGPDGLSHPMASRRDKLIEILGRDLTNAEGQKDGPLEFSLPVPHGNRRSVMMTRIEDGDQVFVHASDIQLLDGSTINLICAWKPIIVFASGPPIYLATKSSNLHQLAWDNGLRLAGCTDTLILDHHLLRCQEGLQWMQELAAETGKAVMCAADFMKLPRRLLEARRPQLYEESPVPEGWHEAYAVKQTGEYAPES